MVMKTMKTQKAPRNIVLVALNKRHASTTTRMKDRRAPRGGQRNKQVDYRDERY
jgi:hypothetical protein